MVQTMLLASLPCKSFNSVVIISHHLLPLPIQHSKAHRHIILRRHLHTSAHLHMREGRGIAYGRGGSGARLARAVKMPLLFFPSRLSHLGCATSSVLLTEGQHQDTRRLEEMG